MVCELETNIAELRKNLGGIVIWIEYFILQAWKTDTSSVTRLGEFSTIGQLLTLGSGFSYRSR
jgi:hypothetical protein